jgi:hypothetical protein
MAAIVVGVQAVSKPEAVMARGRVEQGLRGTGDAAARVIPFGPLLEALVSAQEIGYHAASGAAR